MKSQNNTKPLLIYTPFQLTQPLSYINFLIRKITGSRYDHGAILYQNGDGIWYITEALGKGVVVQNVENFLENNKKRKRKYFTFDIHNNPDRKLMKSLWGKHYEFDIFWRLLGFCLSLKFFGENNKITKLFSTETSSDRYFCFEYLADVYGFEKPHLITGKFFEKNFELREINLENYQ